MPRDMRPQPRRAGARGVVLLAMIALMAGWPVASDAFPRPDDAALVVTTAAPSSTTDSTMSNSEANDEGQQSKSQSPPQIRSLHVNSMVQYRYAHTVVSSRVANPANRSQEVTFFVVLPETAFISSFAMEVDGKVYEAYVKEKQEAKQTYDAAVAAGQSAAHVAVSARDSNSFTVSLNVEPGNKVSFNLTYEELLSRRLQAYEHVITLNPGQVVQDLQVRVHIKENKNITKLRVPEFAAGNKVDSDIQECDDRPGQSSQCSSGKGMASITWKSPSEVEVLFTPTEAAQREIATNLEEKMKKEREEAGARSRYNGLAWGEVFQPSDSNVEKAKGDHGLNGQVKVLYDVVRDPDGGEVVVNDGYFVHFFSPSSLEPLRKHAIFVLDVSGSMDGRKIEQLKDAMSTILDDLKEGDYFTLISFSSDVKVFNLEQPSESPVFGSSLRGEPDQTKRPPAYKASKENIMKAKEIVKQMSAYGGTNIFDALKIAVDWARKGVRSDVESETQPRDQPMEPIILFLTDGDPTVGMTAPTKITAGIRELNLKPRTPIFALAFGDGADIKFLRKLSIANGGFARTIYEAADASIQLEKFYRQISSPLLANVTFGYIPDKIELDSMTKVNFRSFFDGSELVVAGRTADKSIQEVGGDVKAIAADGMLATYKPHLVAVDGPLTIYPFDAEGPLFNHTQAPRHATVLERLWAYLTIKQLLDEQDALDAAQVQEDTIVPTLIRRPPPPLALPAQPSTETVPTDSPSSTTRGAEDPLDLSVLKPEPKKKALELALKYSFVTPLTSLVVVKPNETERKDTQTVNPTNSASAPTLLAAGNRGSAATAVLRGPPIVLAQKMMSPGVSHSLALASSFPGAWRDPAQTAQTLSLSLPGSTFWSSHTTLHSLSMPGPLLMSRPLLLPSMTSSSLSNISDVKWIPKDVLQTLIVSIMVNNTNRSYKLGVNESDPDPPQSCGVLNGSAYVSGVCRHFSHCVLSEVTERIEDFVNYQCPLGDFLAICCPSDVNPTS